MFAAGAKGVRSNGNKIADGIAQAYCKIIPAYMIKKVKSRLDPELLEAVDQFSTMYCISWSSPMQDRVN